MFNFVKSLVFSSTSRDSSLTLLGNAVSFGINFVIFIILARIFSVYDLGLFITALAFSQLVVDFFDFGINSATLNYVSSSSGQNRSDFISSAFILKIFISIILGLVIFSFSSAISEIFFQDRNIEPYIKISSVGIICMVAVQWGQSLAQSLKKFGFAALLNSSTNILRVIALFVLFFVGIFSSYNVYFIFQVILILSFVLLLVFVFKYTNIFNTNFVDIKRLLVFGFFIGLSFAIAAVSSRLDQLLIFKIVGSEESGVYGTAMRIVSLFVLVGASVNSALIPRFTTLQKKDFNSYFKKTLIAFSGVGFLTLISLFFAPAIFPLLFGEKLNSSIILYQILTVGIVFFILSIPFASAILYRYKNTKFSFLISLASLLGLYFLLSYIVPIYKGIGAASVVTLVYLLQFIVTIISYLFLKNAETNSD